MDEQQPSPAARERPSKTAKPRKHRKSNRHEFLSRSVEITSFRSTVRLHAVHHKGDELYIESQPWLELSGTAAEPVKGVKDVRISMYPADKLEIGTARPASVGAVIGARPTLEFVLTWPHADYDRVWALGVSGNLKFAHLVFTKPHYKSALVVNASFSNEMEE